MGIASSKLLVNLRENSAFPDGASPRDEQEV